MDRRRSPDANMAPVLARLVKLLAGLCLASALAIVTQSIVWAIVALTDVRSHGVVALTQPERVAEAEAERARTLPSVPVIRPVTGTTSPSIPAVGSSSGDADEATDEAPASSVAPRAERVLAALNGVSTLTGVGAMLLLPLVLGVAFVTCLVRAPSAAGSTLGGVLWSTVLVGLLLPWAHWWPQLGWGGLFLSYGGLVAEVEALDAVAGPLGVEPLLVHVGIPMVAIAILVGIAWRCGEALHAELLASESLVVDPAIERDAALSSARGATVALGRSARSLTTATDATLDAPGANDSEVPPRRMI